MKPATTDRITDPGIERRRAKRRRRLALLWTLTLALLLGQAGAAYYTTVRARQTEEPAPVSKAAAASPTPRAVAADARIDVVDAAAVVAAVDSAPRPRPKKRRGARARRARRAGRARLSGRMSDVKVPRGTRGDAAQGARIARAGCGLCHGRAAGPLNPRVFSPRQWSRYFARGLHGRHTPWRNNFTRAELAHVKAYLMKSARRR